jgi:hypothetical protein
MGFVRKSNTSTVGVEEVTFKGGNFIAIRVFVAGLDGALIPTKEGLTLPVETAVRVALEILDESGYELN